MRLGLRAYVFTAALTIVVMIGLIVWAANEKSIFEIFRLLMGERWGIVTLVDLYAGFVVVGTWMCVIERRLTRCIPWLIALFFLGNIATLAFFIIRARSASTFTEVFTRISPKRSASSAPVVKS